MDRNSIVGLILIMGIVITYTVFFSEKPQQKPQQQEDQVSSEQVEADNSQESPDTSLATELANMTASELAVFASSEEELSDSLKEVMELMVLQKEYGGFAAAARGEEKAINIKTDLLDVNISNKGGAIKSLFLNNYLTYFEDPLPVIQDHPDNLFSLGFTTRGDKMRNINTSDLYFDGLAGDINVPEGDSAQVRLRAAISADSYLEFLYTFRSGTYNIGFEVNFVGMDKVLKNKTYEIHWISHLAQTEKSIKVLRDKSGIYYKIGDEVDYMTLITDEPLTQKETQIPLDWVGFNGQFFTNTLKSDPSNSFTYYDFHNSVPMDSSYAERMEARIGVPVNGGNMSLYTGPLQLSKLKEEGRMMNRQLNLGYSILKHINSYFIYPLFQGFESIFGNNYGLIIFVLALLIRLLISPLTYKAYISQSKMRVLNKVPEIQNLEKKYKNDPTKLQQEKMAVYRQYGVSMFGGCMPMLLQWPFLVSLFFFFPALIELRQVPFLWAEDLSAYDSIYTFPAGISIPGYGSHISLFTLLMAVTFFIYTIINQKTQQMTGMQNNPMMKYIPYIMPVVILVFLNSYSSGLSYYYFLSTLMSITQTTATKYFVKDERLMEMIEEQRKKKKASGKKGRMEQWLEKQQKRQREMAKTRRK